LLWGRIELFIRADLFKLLACFCMSYLTSNLMEATLPSLLNYPDSLGSNNCLFY
jgi:hypothetical protein